MMKTRKALLLLLVLCILLSTSAVAASAAIPKLTLKKPQIVVVADKNGKYASGKVQYTFTPKKSGSYAFVVSYEEDLKADHEVYLAATTESGTAEHLNTVIFQAKAGEVCTLSAEYYGEYNDEVTYTFSVKQCKPLESVSLECEEPVGYVGDSLYVKVNYRPLFHEAEEITCSSSDPEVVQIAYYDQSWLELKLLKAGEAKISVTTASGKTDAVTVRVVDSVALEPGKEHDISIPANGGSVKFTVTPEEDGCFVIHCDNETADISLNSFDYYYDYENDNYIYRLQAGKTYRGHVYNWSEESISCKLSTQTVQVQLPTAIKITKPPKNTTYIRDMLELLLLPGQVLVGTEMEVSWPDDTKTVWSFDANGPYLGYHSIEWEIREDKKEKTAALVLTCGELTAACEVTLLNVGIKELRMDTTPIQITEDTKYFDEDQQKWMYPAGAGMDREIEIVFTDGTTVTAMPGDMVYGLGISYTESQAIAPWEKGGENMIVYSYADTYVTVPVEIVDPPTPTEPTETTEPTEVTEPTETTEPTEPAETTAPTEATVPAETTEPTETTEPAQTTEPTETTVPAETEDTDPNESNPSTGDADILTVIMLLFAVISAAALLFHRRNIQ